MNVENKILNDGVKIKDLPYEEVKFLYDGIFSSFSPDFFNQENEMFFKIPRKINEEQLTKYNLPQKGIITNDGTIYIVYGHHIVTGMWLRANNVNLENSVRYAVYPNGLEIYPSYESFGKIDNVNNFSELQRAYIDNYENNNADNVKIIALSSKQVATIVHVASKFNVDALDAVTKTNSFGFLKQPYEYENSVDVFKAKYNRLYFEELGFDFKNERTRNK